jgi:AcrR family transcriptional regulator
MILDATDRLMRRDGYGAVSTRRVAAEAGLKAPLVHYYYPTIEDLLLAFYRRSAAQTHVTLEAALASNRPLHALWQMNTDPERTALAAEFIALANHRKTIRDEIARNVELFRTMQADALGRLSARFAGDADLPDVEVIAVLIAAAGRALVTETTIGISAGHAATRTFVAKMIARLEP